MGITFNLYRNFDGTIDGRYKQGDKPEASWQLPASNFISAKMPMVAVYPRPDAETTAAEYPRNAHQGIEYKIPLAVQGGAWPFYYELIAAPSGTTLGETHGSVDYGVLKWTPSGSSGTESFHVRVHDQDGNTVDIQWSSTIGTDWVRFIDPVNGLDTNDGSISAPFQTLQHAFNNLTGGKHICLRQGTHAWNGGSLQNTTILGMFGYTGETAIVDCTNAGSVGFWLNHDGHTVQDLTFQNSPSAASGSNNPRWFSSLSTQDRVTQVFCTFEDGKDGVLGDDNNSCLFLGNGGSQRQYVVQSHCTFRNLERTGNGFSSIDTYSCQYLVCQLNTFDTPAPSASRYCIWIKGGACTEITVRANTFNVQWNGTGGGILAAYLGLDGLQAPPGNQEFCYNTILGDPNSTSGNNHAVHLAAASQAGQRSPIWLYRNTIQGTYVIQDSGMTLDISIEDEVIINDCVFRDGRNGESNAISDPQPAYKVSHMSSNDALYIYRDPTLATNKTVTMTGIECHGEPTDNIIDANHKLTGSYRTNWLGKRGAEISA